jgi:hypothetical protein
MDRWLGKPPAFLHVKPGLWAVLNNRSEMIIWTEDANDAAWYFHEIQPREVPQLAKKKKYKRSPYGSPPKWRRDELARIANAHRAARTGGVHSVGQVALLTRSAPMVVESGTPIARTLSRK